MKTTPNKHAIIHSNETAYNDDIALFKTVLSLTVNLPKIEEIKQTMRNLKDRLNYCNNNNLPYVDTVDYGVSNMINNRWEK